MMQHDGTLSLDEVARFDALAQDWWAPDGPMAPLHRMNPLRARWITQRLAKPLAGEILDIGCGAGLLAEALAKAGFSVLGLDAAEAAIAAARVHAQGQNLPLRYRAGRIEDVIAEGTRFPVVTALEVIEHVPDPQVFLQRLAEVLEPGGLLFVSTLNRSLRSLLTAKIGAEYILRLLPAGTHTWRQFIPPAQLATMAASAGLRVTASAGMSFDPWRGQWRESRDLSINYIMAFGKAA
ncbi:bifunctional 2-polyprenyl-6-hydroxyphenol methylase/3-demethylubiquinol 3-O-methyltransferase UbiG [Acidisoma cladoniae]|jgi:2-polyprenyl-6-hydroxyphenyl methylase/3-demethylubiquinone-9 3-methyltransferase|uniref:bifunctional 2-polyprenyl-6-hydroxyphenol methylase/3-demethylubiquinol 3-O-methyltransferase UbiG n=1 Tax=Acidisoma cladoniae TaxID=3040935 RepID=UPI002551B4E8|nr:bifunctional 2-polyprenyl-6-hydroxyphenol methylase/3-demethylubiquinol 3-O-methyltransferase UbiG [Acidisoma sp. PAMC 29798]